MVQLRYGRTLGVAAEDKTDVLELRDGGGNLELRLKLTEDGVVLQLEAARISLKADQSIDLDCKTLNINADSEATITSAGDLRVRGERVYIN